MKSAIIAGLAILSATGAYAGSFEDCMRRERHGRLTPADQHAFCEWAASPTDLEPDPEPGTLDKPCVAAKAAKIFKSIEEGDTTIYGYPTAGRFAAVVLACGSGQWVDRWRSATGSSEQIAEGLVRLSPNEKYVYDALEKAQDQRFREFAAAAGERQRQQEAAEASKKAALKVEEDRSGREYYTCLMERSEILGRASAEPAETVAQATFAACRGPREKFVDAWTKEGDDGEGTVSVFDARAEKEMILKIIEARATPAPAPAEPTQPKPSGTSL